MNDLPTREQVSEWLSEFADSGDEPLDLVILRQRLVPMYADGDLVDGKAIAGEPLYQECHGWAHTPYDAPTDVPWGPCCDGSGFIRVWPKEGIDDE